MHSSCKQTLNKILEIHCTLKSLDLWPRFCLNTLIFFGSISVLSFSHNTTSSIWYSTQLGLNQKAKTWVLRGPSLEGKTILHWKNSLILNAMFLECCHSHACPQVLLWSTHVRQEGLGSPKLKIEHASTRDLDRWSSRVFWNDAPILDSTSFSLSS